MGDNPNVSHRFFRSSEAVYRTALAQVNAALGLPANGQVSAFAFAEDAPRDSQGRCYLATYSAFCEHAKIAGVLAQLMADGLVEEIDAETYGRLGE